MQAVPGAPCFNSREMRFTLPEIGSTADMQRHPPSCPSAKRLELRVSTRRCRGPGVCHRGADGTCRRNTFGSPQCIHVDRDAPTSRNTTFNPHAPRLSGNLVQPTTVG
jgi:hypothetical protein